MVVVTMASNYFLGKLQRLMYEENNQDPIINLNQVALHRWVERQREW